MGGGAVSDGAEDRLRGGVRGDRGAALCTVFRADAGADGLLLAISMEPCSPKLRICVCNSRVVLCPRGEERDMRLTATLLFVLLALTTLARADGWSKPHAITGTPQPRVATSDANIRVHTCGQNTIHARLTTERYRVAGVAHRLISR